ncbi:MAG: hypothetical protein HEP71_27695 [Roseivirga sp.]|nr:hypothetical protein [Roseivirga sp.]
MAESKYDYTYQELMKIRRMDDLFSRLEKEFDAHIDNFLITKKPGLFNAKMLNTDGKIFLNINIKGLKGEPNKIQYSTEIDSNPVGNYFKAELNEGVPEGHKKRYFLLPVCSFRSNEQNFEPNDMELGRSVDIWIKSALIHYEFELPAYYETKEETYTNEFFYELKFVDKDADLEPFPLKTQLAIDAYLEDAIVTSEKEQERTGKDYSEVIEAAQELRKTQAELSKNETLRKLSNFWAKARVKSIPFLKSLFTKAAEAFLIEIGKKMIGF